MDYYKTLGVSKNASQDEIKKAYRNLAKTHHPDRGGDEKQFQKINEAYDILKDPSKRSEYDNPQPQQQSFRYDTQNMNDMFNQFFRQQTRRVQRNQDIGLNVRLNLKDVMFGKDVIGRYNLLNGQEEIATIRIPAGIEDGTVMRYAGLGDNSLPHLQRGNLQVKITVLQDKKYRRDRSHIYMKHAINVLDLITGTDIDIENIDGKLIKLKIPPGTNPGITMSIPGYGFPNRSTGRNGNLYVEIKGVTPKVTSYELLEKVKLLNDEFNTST